MKIRCMGLIICCIISIILTILQVQTSRAEPITQTIILKHETLDRTLKYFMTSAESVMYRHFQAKGSYRDTPGILCKKGCSVQTNCQSKVK